MIKEALETGNFTKESERQRIKTIIRQRSDNGEQLLVGETDDFLVVYNGGRDVYKRFGSYLDTDPISLAQFLEIHTANLSSTLDITLNHDQLYVVEVAPGKGLVGFFTGGIHLYNESHNFKGEWSNVQFSEVRTGAQSDYLTPDIPLIYNSAAHEVIGHAVIQPQLSPQLVGSREKVRNNFLGSLSEGTAEFCENLVMGIDSHYDYAHELVRSMGSDPHFGLHWFLKRFEDYSVQHGLPKSERTQQFLRDYDVFVHWLPLKNIFDLGWDKENIWRMIHYSRGASLNQFILDAFGIEVYKNWASTTNLSNYQDRLTEVTGVSREELQQNWKNYVLLNMRLLIDSNQHGVPSIFGGSRKANQAMTLIEEFS